MLVVSGDLKTTSLNHRDHLTSKHLQHHLAIAQTGWYARILNEVPWAPSRVVRINELSSPSTNLTVGSQSPNKSTPAKRLGKSKDDLVESQNSVLHGKLGASSSIRLQIVQTYFNFENNLVVLDSCRSLESMNLRYKIAVSHLRSETISNISRKPNLQDSKTFI